MPGKPKAIGYIRVSRVSGRDGDSFISPREQRMSIERVCDKEGLTLVDVVEELDASGGDNSRPLWNKCLERIERGEAKALVVWNLDRFSRSVVDGFKAIERIENAGGRLYSEDGASGTLDRGIRLLIAQDYREKATVSAARARANAIARGVYIARRVPFGYIKNEDKKLEVDPATAPIVIELFERRSRGESWVSLVRWFSAAATRPNTSRGSLRDMIGNVAYLGHARSGEYVNRKAHDPIISQRLFDRANKTGSAPRHDGSISSKTLLAPTCGTCHHRMQANNSQGKTLPGGKRAKVIAYSCLNLHCEARASIRASDLEPWVVGNLFWLLELRGTTGYELPTKTDPTEAAQAQQDLEDAEYMRQWHIDNLELRRILGPEEYNAQLIKLNDAVEECRIALAMLDEDEIAWVEDIRSMWKTWTTETKREWLRSMVDSVTVFSVNGKRGIPIPHRVYIVYRAGWEIGKGARTKNTMNDEELKREFLDLGMAEL